MPRFHIKIDHGFRQPFVLKDRSEPAYMRRFASLRAAVLFMDNRAREERGMPKRLDMTRDEIREAMGRRHASAPCSLESIISEPTA